MPSNSVVGLFNERADLIGEGEDYIFYRPGLDAFKQWWTTNNCAFMANVEAGFRGLGLEAMANWQASKRQGANCYTSDNTNFVATSDEPTFFGGQCAVNYLISLEVFVDGSLVNSGTSVFLGPIRFIEVQVLNGTSERVLIGWTNGSGVEQQSPWGEGFSPVGTKTFDVVSIVRQDGLPDDCGNLPGFNPPPVSWPMGQELPPAPAIGDEIVPTQIINVDVDLDGDILPVSFEFGPVIFCGLEGSTYTLNGLPVKISPDGHHSVDFTATENQEDQTDLNDKLDEIESLLKTEVVGASGWDRCEGDPYQELYSGQGIDGLSVQLQSVLSVVNQGVSDYCPLLEESSFEGLLLATATVPANQTSTFTDVALPTGVLKIGVEVEGMPRPYANAGANVPPGDDIQGRFAVISTLYVLDGERVIANTINQYYVKGVYDAAPPSGQLAFARISLSPGLSATVRSYK